MESQDRREGKRPGKERWPVDTKAGTRKRGDKKREV